MQTRNVYESWLNEPSLDETTRAELQTIAGDTAEIEERFYRELEFGTAGLRGILGAGTNRMNVYVVRRATQGLSNFLLSCDGAKERGVCIAYDSRLFSPEFARETACVLAANGIKTYLFSTLHSVPQLSYAVRHLGCMAGVVITASHNPSKYNGYKVYWAYG
ncbi:MAG: phospho-sugar mutase, partial [Alphaproteobacteria bacterium]|nr:phospho-sugar mutase [Alphaproteobacteria bacterium]